MVNILIDYIGRGIWNGFTWHAYKKLSYDLNHSQESFTDQILEIMKCEFILKVLKLNVSLK